MAETFKLPCSSYEELIKLFQAYANTKEGTALSLDEITQATGVPRTIVSKNNGFMVQVGLITEGNKKAATETGRALGRAYTSKITDEVERIWKEIIAEVDFLNRMLSAVRIRNGMDRSSFINHIIYSSGLKDAKESRAGAGALIEIFKSVGVLSEVDGKLSVLDEPLPEYLLHQIPYLLSKRIQNRLPNKRFPLQQFRQRTLLSSTSISTVHQQILMDSAKKLVNCFTSCLND